MDDLVLVLEQPVNRRLIGHGLVDGLPRRLAVNVEQDLVVEILDVDDARVQPDRHDNAEVVRLVFGNIAGAHRVEHAHRRRDSMPGEPVGHHLGHQHVQQHRAGQSEVGCSA